MWSHTPLFLLKSTLTLKNSLYVLCNSLDLLQLLGINTKAISSNLCSSVVFPVVTEGVNWDYFVQVTSALKVTDFWKIQSVFLIPNENWCLLKNLYGGTKFYTKS